MAHGLKCYCCGTNNTSDDFYYCLECLEKLQQMFANNENVLSTPTHCDHCISCGEFENRKILWTGGSKYFLKHSGDGVPICDGCVEGELSRYGDTK